MSNSQKVIEAESATREDVAIAQSEILARFEALTGQKVAQFHGLSYVQESKILKLLEETDLWQLTLALVDSTDALVATLIQQIHPRAQSAVREELERYRDHIRTEPNQGVVRTR
jgi:hypothetical protein